MAEFKMQPTVQAKFVLVLSEQEAGALHQLTGYGTDQFLEVFYKHLGKAYLGPYEQGLRSLFESIKSQGYEGQIERLEEARAVFSGRKIAVHPTAKARLTALDLAREA